MAVQGTDLSIANWFIAPADAKRSLLALISEHPAVNKQQLKDRSEKDHVGADLTCFPSLVAGTGSLQTSKQHVRVLPFRYTIGTCIAVMGF